MFSPDTEYRKTSNGELIINTKIHAEVNVDGKSIIRVLNNYRKLDNLSGIYAFGPFEEEFNNAEEITKEEAREIKAKFLKKN